MAASTSFTTLVGSSARVAVRSQRTRSPSACCAAPKLYTNPRTRGKIVEWYAKEIGCELDLIQVDMQEGEHKAPAFLEINPFGKLPALEDGDLKMMESGALLLYLADKFGGLDTPEKRAEANQWVVFANSSMTSAMQNYMSDKPEGLEGACAVLEKILSEQAYLTGDELSVADIAVGSYLLYFPMFLPTFDFAAYPALQKYMAGLAERPARAEVYPPPPPPSE